MCCLCNHHHSSFWQSQSKWGLMRSIKISFFGNPASICVTYVIHQIFLFWKSGINMCCLCHPSKFPFLEIRHQTLLFMSPITIFLFGNPIPKWVSQTIHQNFLFWKFSPKIGCLCHLSKFPFLETRHQNVLLMSSIKLSFFGKSHDLLM